MKTVLGIVLYFVIVIFLVWLLFKLFGEIIITGSFGDI